MPARLSLAVMGLAAALALPGLLLAQETKTQDKAWDPLRFLAGRWSGEGSGTPGQGNGGFTVQWDLQNAVLIRKNRADYPATKDRPAFSHEDLMVIHRQESTAGFRAVYFDSEGHVIHYSVQADDRGVVFLSEPQPSAPRYRLTYRKAGTDRLAITFEIAPAGSPDAFKTYIEATARRES